MGGVALIRSVTSLIKCHTQLYMDVKMASANKPRLSE